MLLTILLLSSIIVLSPLSIGWLCGYYKGKDKGIQSAERRFALMRARELTVIRN